MMQLSTKQQNLSLKCKQSYLYAPNKFPFKCLRIKQIHSLTKTAYNIIVYIIKFCYKAKIIIII